MLAQNGAAVTTGGNLGLFWTQIGLLIEAAIDKFVTFQGAGATCQQNEPFYSLYSLAKMDKLILH